MFYRIIALLSALTVSVCLCGCSHDQTPAVFGYISCDSTFDMVFPSDTGDVRVSVEKTTTCVDLTITSPERSADMRVVCSSGGCVLIPVGEGGIPLSDKAAAGLCEIFSLLYRGNDGAQIKRSDDGGKTVIIYGDGEIIVGNDMLPLSVTTYGEHGRTVLIRNYKVT